MELYEDHILVSFCYKIKDTWGGIKVVKIDLEVPQEIIIESLYSLDPDIRDNLIATSIILDKIDIFNIVFPYGTRTDIFIDLCVEYNKPKILREIFSLKDNYGNKQYIFRSLDIINWRKAMRGNMIEIAEIIIENCTRILSKDNFNYLLRDIMYLKDKASRVILLKSLVNTSISHKRSLSLPIVEDGIIKRDYHETNKYKKTVRKYLYSILYRASEENIPEIVEVFFNKTDQELTRNLCKGVMQTALYKNSIEVVVRFLLCPRFIITCHDYVYLMKQKHYRDVILNNNIKHSDGSKIGKNKNKHLDYMGYNDISIILSR